MWDTVPHTHVHCYVCQVEMLKQLNLHETLEQWLSEVLGEHSTEGQAEEAEEAEEAEAQKAEADEAEARTAALKSKPSARALLGFQGLGADDDKTVIDIAV
mmetsp:Transcript_11485/g.23997  ORF Transcript_11485/g.23997 Transcript_11485/m.23997 type:complete len:101 (-) Transcript_11485:137-439(-)